MFKPLSLTKPGKTGHHTGSGGLAAEFTSTRDAFDDLEKRQKELEQLWASLTGYHEMVQRLTALEAKVDKTFTLLPYCDEPEPPDTCGNEDNHLEILNALYEIESHILNQIETVRCMMRDHERREA